MSKAYTIQSNARRAARKAGVDPNSVYCVPEGWKFPDSPTVGEVFAAAIETVAAEPSDSLGGWDVVAGKIPMPEIVRNTHLDKNLNIFTGEPLAPEPDPIKSALRPHQVASIKAIIDYPTAKAATRKPKTAKPVKPTKAKPAAKPRGKRDGVCDRVIAAIRARWTSVDELMKLSGWQRHTLRGYISTRAGKDGFTVERRKVEGVSQYRVA